MSKSYRIRTTPGEDNGYLKVNVDLNQNYDHLEILSLKISQVDEYQNYCSDYGVIAGRVDVNNGFGVPNVKVSIFVPVEEVDLDNPIISKLYPYEDPFPDKKNVNGIRYNILPKNKQSLDHTPVGTFPKKREILDDATTLEIYEKYYKYTTTTNKSGDYILFGVPLGEHYLHYDCDISDIGFISSRPYEMISEGYSEDLFDGKFKFKGGNNLDSLSQIFSQNIPITVEPFWCDSLSVGSPLGINRRDISINYEVTPTAIFMGSIFSDDEKDSLNKNCKPGRQMGKMNEVITGSGKIESLRRNVDGGIEKFNFNDNSIDENGNWSVLVPMNIRKVVTDEFGNLVPSPDGIAGIATEGDYRFRISMDASDTDKRLRQRAKFLVPNTNNNFNFDEYSQDELRNSTDFTVNEQLSTITDGTQYENDITNQYNYLEEFYPFRWKKVYTVKQYIGRMQKANGNDEARGFIGIKDIINAEGVNKFPSNRFDTSIHPLYSILCILLTFVGHLIGFVNGILMMFNGLITEICQFKFPVKIAFQYCFRLAGVNLCNKAYRENAYNGGSVACNKCKNNPNGVDEPTFIVSIGWKCLFGGIICQNCNTLCPNQGGFMGTPPNNFKFRCCGWFFGNGTANAHPVQYPCKQNEQSPPATGYVGCNSTSGGAMNDASFLYTYQNCSTSNQSYYPSGNECGDEFDSDGNPQNFIDSPCGKGTITFTPPSELPSPACCPWCCIKIPLIPLKCNEEGKSESVTILSSPFGPTDCNRRYAKPGGCVNCGGYQTQVIKDWVSCLLEPVAVFLKMLKFDFYNDWVGGSLYFPLIKRKYKLKKRGRKFGQIKKDKFCDFDCYDKKEPGDFQGDDTYQQWRIKVKDVIGTNPTITVDGCKAKVKGKRVTNWYGTVDNDDQIYNLNLAVKELTFGGTDTNSNGCNIKFATWDDFTTTFTSASIDYEDQSKDVATEHGKPEYIETDDGFGNSTWKNIGGHGHHKNSCDNTNMVERKEFFKTTLDCLGPVLEEPPGDAIIQGLTTNYSNLPCNDPNGAPGPPLPPYLKWQYCLDHEKDTRLKGGQVPFNGGGPLNGPTSPSYANPAGISKGFCISGCDPDCGSNGVAPCKKTNETPIRKYNEKTIRHGLISWYNEEIYYTPRIKESDSRFNPNEYKGNLLLPTTILELGSSVYCDIDDVPFIMDQLPPTTFAASFEDMKYKLGTLGNPFSINQSFATANNLPNSLIGESAEIQEIKSYDDKKDSSLNLRAYVEFSCVSVVCANTSAAVNQSQLGVEIIDKNDIGIEIGNCFVRFEHDTDLREYFCKRFNGYRRNGDNTKSLSFHHTRPGSIEFDNTYGSYPEITLTQGYNLFYKTPEGETILSEYNDGDSFIPGDGCGYKPKDNGSSYGKPDYFYGLAPGQTSGFINYPNYDTDDVPGGGTIIFGTAQDDGTDEIFSGTSGSYEDDDNNGSVDVKGVRHNRSQTPYFLYFGLVPGKTALNKVVGKFFGDKINAVTLEGIGASPDDVSQNNNNNKNLKNGEENPFTTFRTCLGDTLIDTTTVGDPIIGGGSGGSGSGGSGPIGIATFNTVTDINGNSPQPINCSTQQSYAISFINIVTPAIPITLTLNGGTNQNTIEWRIILYEEPVTQSSILSSSDVTMTDTNGQIYEIDTSYPNQAGGSTDISILFNNSGNYQAYIYYVGGCAGGNYNGGITISV